MNTKYDFYIRSISDDPNDPAYEAYIPKWNAIVMGENFKELEEGIAMVREYEEKQAKKRSSNATKKRSISKRLLK